MWFLIVMSVLSMPPRKEERSYAYNIGTRLVLCLLIGVSSFPLLNGRCKIPLTPIDFLFTYKHLGVRTVPIYTEKQPIL
jgi:hypothetical protein